MAYLKLTDDNVREIVKLLKDTDISFDDIGKKFGVSGSSIKHINAGTSHGKLLKKLGISSSIRTIASIHQKKIDTLSEDVILGVVDMLKRNCGNLKIIRKYNVSPNDIKYINNGEHELLSNGKYGNPPFRVIKRKRLSDHTKMKIKEMILLNKFSIPEIAKTFNTTPNTVRVIKRKMISENISTKKKVVPVSDVDRYSPVDNVEKYAGVKDMDDLNKKFESMFELRRDRYIEDLDNYIEDLVEVFTLFMVDYKTVYTGIESKHIEMLQMVLKDIDLRIRATEVMIENELDHNVMQSVNAAKNKILKLAVI